jgi:hypothetical protein
MELHGTPDGRIGGERFSGGSRATVHERNRVCTHPSCAVRLSIYNGSKLCALHDQLGMRPSASSRQEHGRDRS